MLLTGHVLQKTILKYSYLSTKLYFTDANDLQSINRDIRAGVEHDDKCYSSITGGDVIDGLKSIKHGKQDGHYGLTSDHLINSSNKFKIVLSMVMSSMMVHGCNANDLLSSTVISIQKTHMLT